MATTQLSRAAYERLQAEFEDLTTRGRIEVAQKIEAARLLGDLSENGDYHAAKDEQGHMEGRIRQLEHLLENSEIVEVDRRRHGVHRQHRHPRSTRATRATWPSGTSSATWRSRSAASTWSARARRSASALLGKRPGDTVEYEAPNGTLRVELLEVEAS